MEKEEEKLKITLEDAKLIISHYNEVKEHQRKGQAFMNNLNLYLYNHLTESKDNPSHFDNRLLTCIQKYSDSQETMDYLLKGFELNLD